MSAENCIKCGEEAGLDSRLHCPDCSKEHIKMEVRLEARVEVLYELIDHLKGEVECFIGDFNGSLDDDERPQMLKDIADWEKRLRESGKALTHLRYSSSDWMKR
jgi:hypothetical protein